MKVVIVLSGGVDSAVVLAEMLSRGMKCAALTVDYGQRHRREVESARAIARHYEIEHQICALSGFGSGALTDPTVDVPFGHFEDPVMKKTVIPGRNALLLALAGGYAASLGAEVVAYGAHAGDRAIYPDCRAVFVEAMREVLKCMHYDPIDLAVPFLHWTKGQIIRRGVELSVPFEFTWTCYLGGKEPCGKCGSCVERAEAFGAL